MNVKYILKKLLRLTVVSIEKLLCVFLVMKVKDSLTFDTGLNWGHNVSRFLILANLFGLLLPLSYNYDIST